MRLGRLARGNGETEEPVASREALGVEEPVVIMVVPFVAIVVLDAWTGDLFGPFLLAPPTPPLWLDVWFGLFLLLLLLILLLLDLFGESFLSPPSFPLLLEFSCSTVAFTIIEVECSSTGSTMVLSFLALSFGVVFAATAAAGGSVLAAIASLLLLVFMPLEHRASTAWHNKSIMRAAIFVFVRLFLLLPTDDEAAGRTVPLLLLGRTAAAAAAVAPDPSLASLVSSRPADIAGSE